jgi:hypothetical protein
LDAKTFSEIHFMPAPATTMAKLAWAADEIEAARPDVAALLRSIRLGREPKPKAHTAGNLKLADAFERIAALIADGADECEAVDAVWAESPGISEQTIWDVWDRKRSAVNAILRERGVLPQGNPTLG